MSIKYKLIRDVWKHPSVKFSEFIDQHNLEICVYERSAKVALPAFFAQIEFGYVKDGAFHLRSQVGDGYDPEDAIEDLKRNLAGHVLVVINAFEPARREIQCPDEWAPE